MLDNPMTTGLAAHLTRNERRDEAVTKAYCALRAEFVTALFANVLTTLPTPAYIPAHQAALDVVADLIDADRGGLLDSMLRLVITCAQGEDPATRLPATALLARMAHAYADAHAHDQAIKDAEQ
jgi:hypothetical protein